MQRVVRRMDAGPVVGRVAVPVDRDETAGDLADRLRPIAAELFTTVLASLDEARPEEQDEGQATAAPKLAREDRRIDFAKPAVEVARRIRAMSPKPGVTAFLIRSDGSSVRVALLRGAVAKAESGKVGEVLSVEDGKLLVGAEGGAVSLDELKPAGKGAMSAEAFIRGYRPVPGDVFVADEPTS